MATPAPLLPPDWNASDEEVPFWYEVPQDAPGWRGHPRVVRLQVRRERPPRGEQVKRSWEVVGACRD